MTYDVIIMKNKDKCVQEQRPNGFVGLKKKLFKQ